MKVSIDQVELTLLNEPSYSVRSTDNVRAYDRELCRNSEYRHSCAHGLSVEADASSVASAILLGVGGATTVHERTIAVNDGVCYVGCGDSLFALKLPSLELLWCRKVDFATCFGVLYLAELDCLVTWGEMDICRLDLQGDFVWKVSGPEIFTEGFELSGDFVLATDFDSKQHQICLKTGAMVSTGI